MSLDISFCKKCKTCGFEEQEIFSANVTHNLVPMAESLGIYLTLWRPEEIDIKYPEQQIPILTKAIKEMKKNPKKYKKLEPENKWGTYNGFLKFLQEYLEACKLYPNARMKISR